ncbi:transposase [Histophilus somni]|nr:transposase [Histophilus somni]
MTKYNQSFKQQVIEFYLQNGENRSLTRQYFSCRKVHYVIRLTNIVTMGSKG